MIKWCSMLFLECIVYVCSQACRLSRSNSGCQWQVWIVSVWSLSSTCAVWMFRLWLIAGTSLIKLGDFNSSLVISGGYANHVSCVSMQIQSSCSECTHICMHLCVSVAGRVNSERAAALCCCLKSKCSDPNSRESVQLAGGRHRIQDRNNQSASAACRIRSIGPTGMCSWSECQSGSTNIWSAFCGY